MIYVCVKKSEVFLINTSLRADLDFTVLICFIAFVLSPFIVVALRR